ncbi:MAG: hypothetical protein AAF085_17705 [Planctomycetota bacterium]
MAKRVFLPLYLVALGVALAAGYQWAKASVAQQVYRDRLVSLQAEYQQLADQYNQAITPRPVLIRIGFGNLRGLIWAYSHTIFNVPTSPPD